MQLHIAAGDDLAAFCHQGGAYMKAAEGSGVVADLRRFGDERFFQSLVHGGLTVRGSSIASPAPLFSGPILSECGQPPHRQDRRCTRPLPFRPTRR